MGRLSKIAVLAFAILLHGSFAWAGVYADDLGKCLVKSSSPDDQLALVKWIYSAMSTHPAVKPYSNFTPNQVAALNKNAGLLFQRLLTVDCRTEAVAALKYEGAPAFQSSFSLLGQIAMRSLMTEPHVAQNFANFAKGLDNKKMKELYAEAGLKPDQGLR